MEKALVSTFVVAIAMLVAYWIGRDTGVKIGANLGGQIKQASDKMHEAARALGKYEPPPFDPPVAIGSHFRYLGIAMLCTAHSHQVVLMPPIDGVKAEYVANDGTVRMTFWPLAEMSALTAEINRAGADA